MTIQEFLFDVDGTLTEPRQKMSSDHYDVFRAFMESNKYSIVSGSDYNKLQEQLPEFVLQNSHYVFSSMGNEIYQNGIKIKSNDIEFPNKMIQDLESFVDLSKSPIITSNHIEQRCGMINFSTIGRNCSREQRDEYYKWDKESNERLSIVSILQDTYPRYDFCIGGMISIDIIPKGKDKSQVLTYIDSDNIIFFGDRILPSGNDWSLAQSIMHYRSNYSIFQIKSPNQTFDILRKLL